MEDRLDVLWRRRFVPCRSVLWESSMRGLQDRRLGGRDGAEGTRRRSESRGGRKTFVGGGEMS